LFDADVIYKLGMVKESLISELASKLAYREQQGLKRNLSYISGVDFCSNDYLGFSRCSVLNSKILKYIQESDNFFLNGSTGSRLISGNSKLVEELEEQIADFHGGSCSLLFSTGYMANVAVASSLAGRNDTFFYDELVHASTRDGIRLSGAKSISF